MELPPTRVNGIIKMMYKFDRFLFWISLVIALIAFIVALGCVAAALLP